MQREGSGDEAASTTKEEMTDLLYLACRKFFRKTGRYPYLCYDQNGIQKNIDVTNLTSHHGDAICLRPEQKIPQPTHSPDTNRPVEHTFGSGKPRVRNNLYASGVRVTKGEQLRRVVHREFTQGMPAGAVKKDVEGLPLLWEIISTPAGVTWEDEYGEMHVGSGGDWGPRASQ